MPNCKLLHKYYLAESTRRTSLRKGPMRFRVRWHSKKNIRVEASSPEFKALPWS